MDDLQRRGLVRATRDPFALPRGLVGRLAGRMMATANAAEQREVADLLGLTPEARLLEIGFGPGELVALLLARHRDLHVDGVDPSTAMVGQATRRNADEVASGRADLRLGAAAELPYADESFDVVVSVNNVRMWPDVPAGAGEVRRVLKQGGRAVVAWHSRTSPHPVQRRLGLPEEELGRLRHAFAALFDEVERVDLRSVVAFVARR